MKKKLCDKDGGFAMKNNVDIDTIDEGTEMVEIMPEIQNLIYVIRGKQVMLDSDLAMLYQVETKRLNEAVKRNISRFPEKFRFQLTKDEYENLKSQFSTSSFVNDTEHGGRRKLPYVFTEQGIAMLSAVLRSEVAIQVSIRIMDTFVELRKYMANASVLYERINSMETRQLLYQEKADKQFERIFDYIAAHEESNQKIFYDGQIFDAFRIMTDLVQQAEKTIVLIDGYVDIGTLNILSKKKDEVSVCIYTFASTRLSVQDIAKFNAQYPKLKVRYTTAFHDRFLILDNSKAYHIGASIKDAGKKCFAINRIEDIGVINDILQRAELTS